MFKSIRKIKISAVIISILFCILVVFVINNTKANADIIEKRTWNSKTYSVEKENRFTTEFHSKWIHYLGEEEWQDIDTNFYPAKDGFKMTNAPFEMYAPLYSTGTATFHNNNRWNMSDKKEINEEPLDMKITALDVKEVKGKIMFGDLLVPSGLQKDVNYVIYEDAYTDGDLIYYVDFGKAPRLEKLVKLNKKPQRLEYKFKLLYSSPVAFEMANGKKWDEEGILETDGNQLKSWKEGSDIRGIAFKQFRIWDNNKDFLDVKDFDKKRNIKPIQSTIISLGNHEYILTKSLPQSFFDNNPTYPVFTDTTSTFYPDANPETNTVDGHVGYRPVATSWANIIAQSTGDISNHDYSQNIAVEFISTGADTYEALYRSIFLFDTSSLTNNVTIQNATFYVWAISGGSSGAMNLVASNPTSNTTIGFEDFSKIYSTKMSDSNITPSDFSVGEHSFPLNTTGLSNISKTGISKFGLKSEYDVSGTMAVYYTYTAGGWYINARFADYTGTDNDPKLVVTYTVSTPTLTQSAYKWFSNTDSTAVGRGNIMNQPAIAPAQGTPFRLRLLLHTSDGQITQNATTSLLQFAQRSGTCDVSFSGESYTSLSSTTGAIRYYNNASATDGAVLTANYEDPRHASSTTGIGYDIVRNQIYSEGENNFSNSQSALAVGEDGLWDFSLVDYSAPQNTTYCFRTIQSGGGVLGSYSEIPEITTFQQMKIKLRGNVKLRQVKLR